MLHSVRMHPLLVTHSRDQEKNSARWKKLEVHEVLVEASRYSLIAQEGTREDALEPLPQQLLSTAAAGAGSVKTPGDNIVAPGRKKFTILLRSFSRSELCQLIGLELQYNQIRLCERWTAS